MTYIVGATMPFSNTSLQCMQSSSYVIDARLTNKDCVRCRMNADKNLRKTKVWNFASCYWKTFVRTHR